VILYHQSQNEIIIGRSNSEISADTENEKINEYAVNTILSWQYLGFDVSVPEWYKKSLKGFLDQLDG
jgi:hypothetical protein